MNKNKISVPFHTHIHRMVNFRVLLPCAVHDCVLGFALRNKIQFTSMPCHIHSHSFHTREVMTFNILDAKAKSTIIFAFCTPYLQIIMLVNPLVGEMGVFTLYTHKLHFNGIHGRPFKCNVIQHKSHSSSLFFKAAQH